MTSTRVTVSDGIRTSAGALLAALTILLSIGLGPATPTAVAAAVGVARPVAVVGAGGGPDPVGEWPLRPPPPVRAGFDPPDSRWGPGHRGVDLAGNLGDTVRTALPGRVSFAGILAGRGVVVVDHGDTRTTYEPVSATVSVGDRAPAGAVIGRLTAVQSHCFPAACLHWGWIRNSDDTYLDPLRLVGGPQPVRLLPLWRDRPVGAAPTRGSAW